MGSMEDFFRSKGNEPEHKLWIEVPPPSIASSSPSNISIRPPPPQIEIRPTLTTLLRARANSAQKELNERSQIAGYIQGNGCESPVDICSRHVDDAALAKKEDVKRLLKAKLSYHKAIAAKEDAMMAKFEVANSCRAEAIQRRWELEVNRNEESQARIKMAKQIAREVSNSKDAAKAEIERKQQLAKEIKDQKKKIKYEVMRAEFNKFLENKQKIREIQKGKVAAKSKVVELKIVGESEELARKAKLELAAQRAEKEAELEARRKKIAEAKEDKERETQRLKQKLEEEKIKATEIWERKRKFKDFGREIESVRFEEDEELKELSRELRKFRIRNRK